MPPRQTPLEALWVCFKKRKLEYVQHCLDESPSRTPKFSKGVSVRGAPKPRRTWSPNTAAHACAHGMVRGGRVGLVVTVRVESTVRRLALSKRC